MKIVADNRSWIVIVILCDIIFKKVIDGRNQLQVCILSRFVNICINTAAQDSQFINAYSSNSMM